MSGNVDQRPSHSQPDLVSNCTEDYGTGVPHDLERTDFSAIYALDRLSDDALDFRHNLYSSRIRMQNYAIMGGVFVSILGFADILNSGPQVEANLRLLGDFVLAIGGGIISVSELTKSARLRYLQLAARQIQNHRKSS
jgi:hypothetical protein